MRPTNLNAFKLPSHRIEQFSVDAVMKATGASADEARDYLAAEESSVEDAIISYLGDKLHSGVPQ